MMEELAKLESAVNDLNDQFSDKTDCYAPFEIATDGREQRITCFGEALWTSEDDERGYGIDGMDDDGELQPILIHLVEEANKFLKVISKVRLIFPPVAPTKTFTERHGYEN